MKQIQKCHLKHFLWKAHHGLLAPGDVRQRFSPTLGGHFKQADDEQK